MEDYLRILDLAAHNALPEKIDEESDLSINSVRELIEAGYLNAIDASSHDGDAFLRPRITLPGREYLKKLLAEDSGKESVMYVQDTARPLVFISHSSADRNIAEAFVRLLRSALNLSPTDIRCTSVEGHRLPAGASTDQELRDELMAAKVMVGLISPGVMASAYVLFELGARWGAKLYLAPLLTPGTGPEILQGPIANMNALRCDSEQQLHQLLGELGKQLGKTVNSPSTYLTDLHAVTQAVPTRANNLTISSGTATSEFVEPAMTEKIKKYISILENEWFEITPFPGNLERSLRHFKVQTYTDTHLNIVNKNGEGFHLPITAIEFVNPGNPFTLKTYRQMKIINGSFV